mmetsp:Transcript_85520/g.190037  ORF Transcript_85520/g.190037 Transcript_85520/m.190037 type:complete len:312 (+) Transcript_85520:129-1064(+)
MVALFAAGHGACCERSPGRCSGIGSQPCIARRSGKAAPQSRRRRHWPRALAALLPAALCTAAAGSAFVAVRGAWAPLRPGTTALSWVPRHSHPSVAAPALAPAASLYPVFKIDTSDFTPEDALRRHIGACGQPPEVEILRSGQENGVYAARGTVRVRSGAYEIFKRLTDPEENARIFAKTLASVNYRKLIEDDKEAGTRLFEVSKTGHWRVLGIPFNFESTVFAVEDWRRLEIRFRLKRPGAMQHMSGFWRMVPIGQHETLVLFYNEAVPSLPVPRLLRTFAAKAVQSMASSLLEELRDASDLPTLKSESA